jgi:predicted DNA-binding transcriptional regulator YafY
MSRSARLLDLVQILRRHRQPVRGQALADELQISLRSLYRDINTLVGQGAPIEGEAGIGYVLKPGYLLPPLMFAEDEIEALVLGSRWVVRNGDRKLAEAAGNALAKISAVLPAHLRDEAEGSGLVAGPSRAELAPIDLADLRDALRRERKVAFTYRDATDKASTRVVWPIAVTFYDRARVLAAWCELRQDYRHFRLDRMSDLAIRDETFPRRRRALMKEWRALEDAPKIG